MGKIVLTGKGRRWVLGGHPWVYLDDIASGEGTPGELVPVEDPAGNTMGWGLFSTSSRIAVRLVTLDSAQPARPFWAGRVQAAIARRERAGLMHPEAACRLVAGDSDGVPGMVIDRYGKVLVLQSGNQGSDRMRDFLVELVKEALPFEVEAILDRSDTGVRRLEQLDTRIELLEGQLPEPLVVREGEVSYEVDVYKGHKTGAYLDQGANRVKAAQHAAGQRVLDAFSYDGLFAIQAALAGAESVLCYEQNQAALERLQRNAERNGVADRIHAEKAQCMQALRNLSEGEERFGMVVLDPPAFARNKREAEGAERGYVELNRRAFTLAAPGAMVVSASCSYNILAHEFVRFLTSAARLAQRSVRLEELTGAGVDHPYLLSLPESRYLKCAFLRVD